MFRPGSPEGWFPLLEHAIGLAPFLVGAILAALLSRRHPTIGVALLVAYSLRCGAALFHYYVTALPDGLGDARALEKIAADWGEQGIVGALSAYPGPDSHFYSWLLSLIYTFTGRNPLMAQGFSVIAGVAAVYLTWRLARDLWGEHHARKAVWVAALFPTLVLYSALTMREPFVVLFLLAGMTGVVRWVKQEDALSFMIAMIGFTAATFFHGGMFVAIAAFLALFTIRHGSLWLSSLRRAKIRVFSTIFLIGVFVCVASYLVIGYGLPKLGTPEDMFDVGRLIHRFNYSNRGTASYPDWAVPMNDSEIAWKVPIRVVYFLFAPFAWDLAKPGHLVGWLDGWFYILIVYFGWRHRRAIWSKPEARAIFLVLLPLVLLFGTGVGNFGTGLRHRAKFVAIGLILIAPRLPRFVVHRRTQEVVSGRTA